MGDDIIEIKPSFGPLALNVRALWRRLFSRRQSDPVAIVAERFLQLFAEHGVAPPQIQQFLPQITLHKLKSPEALLAALTKDVLDQTVKLFGIQRSWLEGTTDRLYRTYTCYKHSEALFELLGRFHYDRSSFPLRALTSTKTLDNQDGGCQPLVLVLVEKIADVDDIDELWDIERYHVFGDDWDWGHRYCRIQLKAMARILDRVFHECTPLFHVKATELEAVRKGRRAPRLFLHGCLLTNPSLEDYGLSPEESRQAKEIEELPFVLNYIEKNNLEAVARRAAAAAG